jgi:hypothetical protein
MELQHQPNSWSCLPTAIAICLDIPVKDLIRDIGHDGSEIIYPDLPEPQKRKAFTLFEIVEVLLVKRNMLTLPLFKKYIYSPDGILEVIRESENFKEILETNIGVLLGTYIGKSKFHAVAWNNLNMGIYDPNNMIHKSVNPLVVFNPHIFLIIRK